MEKGTFRRDLYFRLNVITLRLPPLRNRADDIPDLVEHFLRRYGRGHVMSAEAMEAMLSYEWPGNVRQLEHCIQHMVAVNSGPVLHSRDLPTMLINHLQQPREDLLAMAGAVGVSPMHPIDSFSPPIVPLPELERRADSRRNSLYKGRPNDGGEPARDRTNHAVPEAEGIWRRNRRPTMKLAHRARRHL